jgi:class 3 adenylate cyclase
LATGFSAWWRRYGLVSEASRFMPILCPVSALPSGTVTFLFTDIEGSTELMRKLGDGYGAVLGQERRLLRDAVTDAGGTEIDTQGDAFFFSFTRARDAVAGAVAAQRALAEHEWPEGAAVRVRMGLHTGEPAVGEEGYLGLDVVRAARICSAAHGGQILLSEATRALLGNQLPEGVGIRDLGRQELKDIQDERIFQLTLGKEEAFPALKTEPRGGGKARAELLGEDFGRRIEDYVQRTLAGSLEGRAPELPARELRGLTVVGLATIVALIVGIIVILLVVKLAFF